MSKIRDLVTEALATYGNKGATRDDVIELIVKDLPPDKNPRYMVGICLGIMEDEGLVFKRNSKFYLKYDVPAPTPSVNGNGQHAEAGTHIKIAPFAGRRSQKVVHVHSSPQSFDDITGIQMLINNQWYKLPLFNSIRICIGQEIPMWNPEQESYYNVEVVKFIHQGGNTTEKRPLRTDIVTVAPEG